MAHIILDIDGAGDDILAIVFAAAHPEIKLAGITTTMGAAGSIEQVTKVALNTLALTGRQDVEVYAGAWRPIVGHSAQEMQAPVHFEKRLQARFGERLKQFNPLAPQPSRAANTKHAVDFIIETVKAHPGEITLIATGPTTNLAMAILQEPRLPALLKNMLILGGNFTTPGNITPLSEYNIWADPEAAKLVLAADCPKVLVPLDICEDNRVADSMLTRDDLGDMDEGTNDNAVIAMITRTFPIYIDIWREFFGLVGFPMDDVITVALAVEPELATVSEPLFVDVVLDKGVARGQCVAWRGAQIFDPPEGAKTTRIATNLQGRRFLNLFKTTMRRYERSKNKGV